MDRHTVARQIIEKDAELRDVSKETGSLRARNLELSNEKHELLSRLKEIDEEKAYILLRSTVLTRRESNLKRSKEELEKWQERGPYVSRLSYTQQVTPAERRRFKKQSHQKGVPSSFVTKGKVSRTNIQEKMRLDEQIKKRKHFDETQSKEKKNRRLQEYNKKRRLVEDTECPICLEVTQESVIYYPCLHHTCTSCAKSFCTKGSKCPTCRGSITDSTTVEGKPFSAPFKIGEETCHWAINWNPGDMVQRNADGTYDVIFSETTSGSSSSSYDLIIPEVD